MKIALVTGASSGIGREFAVQIPRLYKNLDELWVVARRTDRLTELQEQIHIPIRVFDGDLMRDYIFERIERELSRQGAEVRMLVNAAGYGKAGAFDEIDSREQLGMIDLNCRALTKMIWTCMPYLTKGSRIVNIASSAAFAPQPGFAVYAASKSYVYSLAQALAAELEPKGISVTAVCPGPVDTEFFRHSGVLPNAFKDSAMADSRLVVRQALKDSVDRKRVSVYGMPMKGARIAAKLLPYTLIANILRWANKMD